MSQCTAGFFGSVAGVAGPTFNQDSDIKNSKSSTIFPKNLAKFVRFNYPINIFLIDKSTDITFSMVRDERLGIRG